MKKETIKQFFLFVFAIAFVSALVAGVGFVFLRFRFSGAYYTDFPEYKHIPYFEEYLNYSMVFLAILLVLTITIIVISFKYKSEKLNKAFVFVRIVLLLIMVVITVLLIMQPLLLTGETGAYRYTYPYLDSILNQILNFSIPFLICVVIAFIKPISEIINFAKNKSKYKNQQVEETSVAENEI